MKKRRIPNHKESSTNAANVMINDIFETKMFMFAASKIIFFKSYPMI